MSDKIIYDVDLASDIKVLVATNRDVTFDDPNLKDKLRTIDDDAFLRVGKKIASLKIVSLDVIDDSFLKKIFSSGNNDQDYTSEKNCM